MSRVVALVITIALLACFQDSVAVGGREVGAQHAAPLPVAASPVTLRGRVVLQGRSTPQDAVIEVTRVSESVQTEVVAEGLEVPWDLAFTPDGRILITERPGRIRVIRDGALQAAPFATPAVESVSESGLMGIALHPRFSDNGFIFVCYTYLDAAKQLRNRVARLTDAGGVGTDHRALLDNIPGAPIHDGCRLRFGPDGKLYVTMGDAAVDEQAQNLNSLSGKVLRLEADGAVPADNPFPGSYVYTYGHRNPQGLDWHPQTGDLFITEHGPIGNDEINILQRGGNYGWPRVSGVANNPLYLDPILAFTPSVAPSGAAFYAGDRLAASWEGNFLFATLRGSHLHRVVLEPPAFRTVLSHESLFPDQVGRLRAVVLGLDGYLYFTTNNRDGRGSPRSGDDKLLRLVPTPSGPPALSHSNAEGNFELQLAPGTNHLRWTLPGFLAVQSRVVGSGGESIDLGDIMLRAGDIDGDDRVDNADVTLMQRVFSLPATPSSATDFNADRAVDVLDLALLAANWGRNG